MSYLVLQTDRSGRRGRGLPTVNRSWPSGVLAAILRRTVTQYLVF